MMHNVLIKNVLLLVCVLLMAGCAELTQYSSAFGDIPEPKAANYLLTCLNDIKDIGPEEFAANFERAEAELQRGRNLNKLRFICLSLHADADYRKFKEGTKVLEQYITDQANSPDTIQGFQILVDRLDAAIMTKRNALKSLSENKTELSAEVEALQEIREQNQALIKELQEQIAQLKNSELTTEVVSLRGKREQDQALIKELQEQIEQLKNIENIIESRETEQP
jgi:chromosome segregation ATPase